MDMYCDTTKDKDSNINNKVNQNVRRKPSNYIFRRAKAIALVIILVVTGIFVGDTGIHKVEAATTVKSTTSIAAKTNTMVNFRKKATTKAKLIATLSKDQKVTILGQLTNNKMLWYKCSTTIKGKKKTGYIAAQYVTKTSAKSTTPTKVRTGYVNSKVTTKLNVRKSASIMSKSLLQIPQKTVVQVLSEKTSNGKKWYRIKATYNKKTATGYVAKEYITIKTVNTNTNSTDQSFESVLKTFPASYHTSLINLHTKYPKWKFVAINTGLNWNDVITNQSIVGRNVIQSNYPRGTASLAPFSYLSTAAGAYDWATDAYVVKDGTNWYSANSQVISYYMDPRNFLNENHIFQFEALAYDTSQRKTVVTNILSNTFMKGNYSVIDSSTKKTVSGAYNQTFMDAGIQAGASPYFLAARVKQEVGVNGSGSVSGTYPGYVGLYNYYNIGAFDGADAISNGLLWANGGIAKADTYGRPWTNPYKAIVGGAQYIAKKYINVGQNTLYFQKFNVTYKTFLYLHQYMTNVQAPYNEGITTKNAYQALGIMQDEMIFYIPVYNNMPAKNCALPANKGNPNGYLKGIGVANAVKTSQTFPLTPSFSYSTLDYSMVVPNSISQIQITASKISTHAKITGGTGSHFLKADEKNPNVISVKCQAGDGSTKTYTIKIIREEK